MLIRDCSGGIVFCANQVLLIQNEKEEWSFPKGVIREDHEDDDIAIWRVKDESGVEARIIGLAGKTSYEFYSVTRKRPVANRIKWYIMVCDTPDASPNLQQGFLDAKFLPIEEAIQTVTYSQDRSLLTLAYQKYKELNEDFDEF
ncbi:MAG: NUDIX domain-containing protein [Clostridiaceae bacterium]|jgi:ADP-ribose pyrophosphatase YjhB (NUDIX family)|nr:NUDIX domain-containing protein [Bacillota bacterium]NLN52134.1 NUDIX domain-containing protein [Clostridiaceae bacterium]